MSGIYIPGMEMPTNCRKCKLKMNCDDCEGWECYCLPLGKNIGYMDDEPEIPSEKRRNDCPLIPVPEHGDLIERKAVYLTDFEIAMCDGDYKEGMKMLLEKIESAPAIIPAVYNADD